ncbi:tetratricopeptide repeat protein [bacterium]
MSKTGLFHIVISILIISASAILYFPTIGYDIVWDDNELLNEEPMASGREHWSNAFSKPVDRLYRPFRTISFQLTRKYTEVPAGHHAISAFLFSCTVICAYWFLYTLTGSGILAALASFLYMLHPVQAEVVPWIMGGRANLMAGPLIFICLVFYLSARNQENAGKRLMLLILSALFFVAALFSKESALITPLIIAALELTFPVDNRAGIGTRLKNIIVCSSPYLILGIAFFLIRTEVLRGTGQVSNYHGGSLYVTAASMLPILTDYLRIIFLPVNLCAVYTPEIYQSPFSGAPLLSLAGLATVFAIGILTVRRRPLLSFAVFWFFICVLPSSNIIPIGAMKANRFIYESTLSGCIIYALVIYELLKSDRVRAACRIAGIAIGIALAGLFLVNTVSFRNIWKDNHTLWAATVKCAPESEEAYNNLGITCYNKGNIQEATEAFERARDLNPGFVRIRENLGQMYATQGRYEEALAEFNAVYFYNPSPDIIVKISLLYHKMGNRELAALWLEKALSRNETPESTKIILREKLKELRKPDN